MKKLVIPFVLLLLLTDSCKKKEDNNGTGNTTVYKTYGSMDEIYAELSLKPKVVTFDAGAGSSFYGNSGTRYVFQPNCFQDATGATVTGTVRVEVTEWVKKGDMIFSKMLPISDGKLLVSGGEIHAYASQMGQQIFLKPASNFQASIPQGGTPVAGMEFFAGRPMTGNVNQTINWRKGDTSGNIGSILYNGDSISIISDSLIFCNADLFMKDYHYESFTVTISVPGKTTFPVDELLCFVLYDTYKGTMGGGNFNTNVIQHNHVPAIPVHFAIFGLIDNKFYCGVVAATPKTGENYTVLISEVEPLAFKAQLNALH